MSANIHEHPEEWLAAALADGLAPEERRALDEHLAGCEPCRALQADLAGLDETLRRDFPAAVGPAAGFQTRLAAGFRRRHGRSGERLARLRALVGWLLRQRGVRFAGMAAALLALVGIGQMITHRTPPAALVPGQIQNGVRGPAPEAGEHLKSFPTLATGLGPHKEAFQLEEKDGQYGFTEKSDVKDQRVAIRRSDQPEASFGALPVPDTNVGRDLAADSLFHNADSGAATGRTDFNSTPYRPSITLGTANTHTGATTISDGAPAARGSASGGDRFGTNFRDQKTDGSINSDAFIAYGSPVQTVTQNTDGVIPFPAGEAAPPSATPAPPDVRKLIRNARAELEVASFDAAVDAVTAAASRDGGFLDTRNSARGGNGKLSGSLVVKVLPENLDRFLAGLRALGEVKNQTIQTEDVTKDYFDTDARLRNSRRMEERLLKMLDEVKGKMSEVLQVEKELARVRADIETMQGQLRLYDAQVRYATVTLNVYEKNLDQPAAFLLQETATLALLAADVERAAAETRRVAEAAHAQVLRSELVRDGSGQWRATLRLLVAADASAEVIAQIKTLGRVADFHLQDERTAQNGGSTAAGADSAKIERAPVAFDVTISHDEQVSRQVSFTLVAADAEGAFEKARAAATAAGGEIVNANVAHTQDGHANATLAVRVPPAAETGLLAALQALGRAGEAETRRVASGADAGAGPVLIQLSVVDVEPAVQETAVQVQTGEVERRADEIKRDAAAAHAIVEGSSFSGESDGRQRAGLKFRLPLGAYPGFIERVRSLGTVKEFTVRREDRPEKTPGVGGDASAPVTVELSLYSEGPVVNANSGLAATLRRTFGQGVGALTWSVQMIGVALAFLVPWAVLLAVIAVGGRWWQRRRSARSGREEKS